MQGNFLGEIAGIFGLLMVWGVGFLGENPGMALPNRFSCGFLRSEDLSNYRMNALKVIFSIGLPKR